ncbi:hypothetical protein EDD99_1697 [Streptomyces sp. 846.5]|nr:hypothetical protein [Streptomyces sp. 846.5]TDU03278.1 hypothetical protein EDD99_1697 [Streptomyces sp. 846.5]
MGLISDILLNGRDVILLWLLAAVLIGEIATWAAPKGTRPWNHALVAVTVSATLVLIPVLAFGPGAFD